MALALRQRVGLLAEALTVAGRDVHVAAVHVDDVPRLRLLWDVAGAGFALVPVALGTDEAGYLAFADRPFDARPAPELAGAIKQRGRAAVRHNAPEAAGMLIGWCHTDVSGRVIIGGGWATWNQPE